MACFELQFETLQYTLVDFQGSRSRLLKFWSEAGIGGFVWLLKRLSKATGQQELTAVKDAIMASCYGISQKSSTVVNVVVLKYLAHYYSLTTDTQKNVYLDILTRLTMSCCWWKALDRHNLLRKRFLEVLECLMEDEPTKFGATCLLSAIKGELAYMVIAHLCLDLKLTEVGNYYMRKVSHLWT